MTIKLVLVSNFPLQCHVSWGDGLQCCRVPGDHPIQPREIWQFNQGLLACQAHSCMCTGILSLQAMET